MPRYNFFGKLGRKGLIVLAVSIDKGSDEQVRKSVKSYVDRKKLIFLNLLDPKSSTAAQYGVNWSKYDHGF